MKYKFDAIWHDGNNKNRELLNNINVRNSEVLTPDGWSNCVHILFYSTRKDKNGQTLKVGDIITFPDTYTESVDVGIGVGMPVAQNEETNFGIILFKDDTFGIEVESKSESLKKGFNTFDYVFNDYGIKENEIEVIDNIFINKLKLFSSKYQNKIIKIIN